MARPGEGEGSAHGKREERSVESSEPLPSTASRDANAGTLTDPTFAERSWKVKQKEDEFVLLDLEGVFHGAALPAYCAYTLTKLDTMNPVLSLGESGLKLIGDYEETVGTCLVFTEDEEPAPNGNTAQIHAKNDLSHLKPGTKKRIRSLCKTERKLKFRMMNLPEKEREVCHTKKYATWREAATLLPLGVQDETSTTTAKRAGAISWREVENPFLKPKFQSKSMQSVKAFLSALAEDYSLCTGSGVGILFSTNVMVSNPKQLVLIDDKLFSRIIMLWQSLKSSKEVHVVTALSYFLLKGCKISSNC